LRYFTEFCSFRGALRKAVEDVIVKMFTFAISSPSEFLFNIKYDVESISSGRQMNGAWNGLKLVT